MHAMRTIRGLFSLAAFYDGILGLLFLFASGAVFDWFGEEPPNHPAYAQFPGALLIVFGILFAAVAANPVKNRNLIPYGMLLKISYCGVIGYHWFSKGLPAMWKPFWVFDLVFLVLFVWAWKELRTEKFREG